MKKNPSIAIILASGEGKRFSGSIPKQYISINNMPIIRKSVLKFISHKNIDYVVVVIKKNHQKFASNALHGLSILPIVLGGKTRQESVFKGLKSIEHLEPNKIIVHDSVRPNISKELITSVLKNIKNNTAVVPVIEVNNTLIYKKRSSIEYKDRKAYRQIQTPQGFIYKDLLFKHSNTKKVNLGDDSELFNSHKNKINIIKGNPKNIKITYKEDLKVLELLFTKTYEEIVGLGFDVHKFSKKPSKIIRLGGIDIKFSKKLEGHSDADVVLHAIVDSILGILNKGDIGQIFSNTDPKWKNANSKIFIQYVTSKLIKLKYLIRHLDITIICEEPKISKHSQKMIIRISELLNIPKNLIAIKATTSEGLGITGKKEGIAVKCLTTIAKPIKNEY